jgi:hypothetical protein
MDALTSIKVFRQIIESGSFVAAAAVPIQVATLLIRGRTHGDTP